VRMGLATGEAQLREGDYFGTVLNRAAKTVSESAAAVATEGSASSGHR
jgi:class 3 adenylate cyclase